MTPTRAELARTSGSVSCRSSSSNRASFSSNISRMGNRQGQSHQTCSAGNTTPGPKPNKGTRIRERALGFRSGGLGSGRFLFLLLLQAGIAAGKFALELLDAAGRVDELQLAGIEGMANVADI